MLVINNGYGKSGTTWIQRGLRYYFDFTSFDDAYRNPKLANPSLDPERILSFLSAVDVRAKDFYSKSHWAANDPIENGRLSQALLEQPGVVVINSVRNIGDSVVSWYHHRKRDGETRDFAEWFWDEGAGFCHRYMSHHMSWAHTKTPPFLFSYENLKRDPFKSFAAFRASIGLEDARPVEAFNHHMDFNVTKAESNTRHMRKGVVGDRVNYLDADMIAHIEEKLDKRGFYAKCGDYLDAYGVDRDDLLLVGKTDA